MTSITPPGERLVSLFTQTPCWMIQPLAAEMHYSIPSVRRFLAEVGYLSSFTHNGGWYTLRSIPRFDGSGLWFYRDIGFSRAGSLTKSLIRLVSHSATGMSAEMLGEILRCRLPRSSGKPLAERKNRQRQDGALSLLLFRRSAHGRRPAPGTGDAESAGSEVFSRNRGPGACGIYPQSGFRLRAIGRENLAKQEGRGQCKGNREAFRSTRAKKNDADCAVRVLEAASFTLKRLSMDTSPAALCSVSFR
jgi:hypothetical protein